MITDTTPTTVDSAAATKTGTEQTVQQVDPHTLLVDVNVRGDTRVDADLIASVRDLGVLVPIIAVRTADGRLRVRFGHRRTLAAIEAARTTVPVVVATDETGDDAAQVERLVTQWAENEHRAGLTTADRVGVIAQLAAFGVSPAQISKRTRAKRGDVTAALAVAGSDLAQAATARYDFLDLAQAATVAEFEDDPEAVKALVVAAKGGQFDHTAQRLRDARAEAAERARVAAELRAVGVRVIDRPGFGDTATDLQRLTDGQGAALTEDSHAGCPGHAAYVTTLTGYVTAGAELPTDDDDDALDDTDDADPDEADAYEAEQTGQVWRSWIGARYVCTDPAGHGHRDRWSGSDSTTDRKKATEMDDDEREAARAQRRDVIESNKAWTSAETVRRTWLRGLLARKTAPKGTGPFLAAALAHDGTMVTGVGGNQLAAELLGCTQAAGYGRSTALSDLVEQASEARALVLALAQVLAGYEECTDRSDWRTVRPHTVRYLRFLEACGYTLAPVEQRACGQQPLTDTPSGEEEDEDRTNLA
jgi:ParB family chromosome partitioning protein